MYVWDVNSRSLQYKLPGHMGSVNEVQFYPESKEPISKFISTVTSTVTHKTLRVPSSAPFHSRIMVLRLSRAEDGTLKSKAH